MINMIMDGQTNPSGLDQGPDALSLRLLALEARASRLAATLDARPALGRLWRAQLALSEAVQSIGLEDVRLQEGDLVAGTLDGRATETDARAVSQARALLRAIRSPGALFDDPEFAFDKLVRSGTRQQLGGHLGDGHDLPPQLTHDEREGALTAFVEVLERIEKRRLPIALAAAALSRFFAEWMPERSPITERLAITTLDHAVRRREALEQQLHDDSPGLAPFDDVAELAAPATAHWVMLPALACSIDHFRIWSPTSPGWLSMIIGCFDHHLALEAGNLGTLNGWLTRARKDFRGKSGKSRRQDLITYITCQPLFDARAVADALSVTSRAALNLIGSAVEAELIVPVTKRRSFRLWSTPSMAQLMRRRASTARDRRTAVIGAGTSILPVPSLAPASLPPIDRASEAEKDARVRALMDELELVVERTQTAMEKVSTPP